MPFWQGRVSSAVERLLMDCAPLRFPIDLTTLAIKQGIARIHFRPIPCEGAIEVADDGFVVHLYSAKEQLVPTSAVDSGALSVRQRFTLAHEISHTFFYDPSRKPRKPRPDAPLLERSCNYGGQCLLLPENLVEREIGTGRRFDSIEMAFDLAAAARVSVDVVIRRLDELERLKETDYALLTLRRVEDGSMVTTGVCLSGVFTKLPRPALYSLPPSWVGKMAQELNAPSGKVHRSTLNDAWEFATRCLPAKQSAGQVLVESRLEMRANSNCVQIPQLA